MAQEQANTSSEAKPKAEKQTNCPVCNKPIKKLKRFYRNGIFYCAKKCWLANKKKTAEEKNSAENKK
jgi:hypothetical protein